jgi:hypothetical protein
LTRKGNIWKWKPYVGVFDATAWFRGLGDVTIRPNGLTRKSTISLNSASLVRTIMEGHLVCVLVIDTFGSINLTRQGQSGPTVQKLGHIEQPTGMLEASMTKRPPL